MWQNFGAEPRPINRGEVVEDEPENVEMGEGSGAAEGAGPGGSQEGGVVVHKFVPTDGRSNEEILRDLGLFEGSPTAGAEEGAGVGDVVASGDLLPPIVGLVDLEAPQIQPKGRRSS